MRLSFSDAGFLYGENATGPLHTAGIVVLAGEVSARDIYRFVERRLHLIPRFRQRLVWVPMNLAHPKWVDDPDFDLEHHIEALDLPPGTALLDAVDQLTELNEPLMDRSRPLWKLIVATGVPDHTVVLQQVHHAMIDGASAVQLSTVLWDFKPDALPPPPPNEPFAPDPIPGPAELIREAVEDNVVTFVDRNPLRELRRNAEHADRLQTGLATVSRFVTQPVYMAPWNAGMLGPKRKMRWTVHPFSEFREVRRALGGTINDVVLATVSEGAARYLEAHDEPVRDAKLRIMCPVNVRTEEEQSGQLGNRVSALFPVLPARSLPIEERLRVTMEEMTRIKQAEEAQGLTYLQESGSIAPPIALAPLQLTGTALDPSAVLARAPLPVARAIKPRPPYVGFNFTCTNVPSVQVPQYMAGLEVLATAGIMMLQGSLGYGVAVNSYNQKMVLSFTGETRLLPDLELMVEHVEGAFADLLAVARAHGEAQMER